MHAEDSWHAFSSDFGCCRRRTRDRARLRLAGQDKRELAATVLEPLSARFLKKDVPAARTAVGPGLSGELHDDDVVYAALWLLFTEKETKTRTDGTASRALGSIKDDGRWADGSRRGRSVKSKTPILVASAR